MLINKIPGLLSGVITGAGISQAGIGSLCAGAVAGAALGAADMAATAASMAGSALMGGAANIAGGMSAIKAAFEKAADMDGGSGQMPSFGGGGGGGGSDGGAPSGGNDNGSTPFEFGEAMYRFPAITISVCNLRPDSRGAIHAATPDAGMAPEIQPNYLATESDRITAVESIRLVRRIVDQPALKRFSPEEFSPGPHLQSDAELAKAAGDVGTTIFHPVGTAKMGSTSDPAAVVDERLRVRGVGKLRVIDASVMPSITSGNTNSPTLMIAEKGAEMLLQDSRE